MCAYIYIYTRILHIKICCVSVFSFSPLFFFNMRNGSFPRQYSVICPYRVILVEYFRLKTLLLTILNCIGKLLEELWERQRDSRSEDDPVEMAGCGADRRRAPSVPSMQNTAA